MDAEMIEEITSDAAFVYVKEGCGFCSQATELLTKIGVKHSAREGSDSATRAKLRACLGLALVTYPVVFVRGMHIGGYDQLSDGHSTGALQHWLSLETDVSRKLPDPVKLTVGPRGQRMCAFQFHVYGNFMRAYALVQVLLFLAVLALPEGSPVAAAIVAVLFLDILLFVLFGASPFPPIATAVSAAVWKFRGPSTTSVPYKVVHTLYVLALLWMLSEGMDSVNVDEWKRSAVYVMLTNSALLAAFRL